MECTTVRDAMLEVLYGEADGDVARRVEDHLVVCAACREEIAAFRRVRAGLRSYTLPALPNPGRRRPALGLAGLAAAAALLAAVGGAFVNARIGALERRLEAQQENHAREIARLQQAQVAAPAAAVPTTEAALIQRVSQMLRESEERQGLRLDSSLRELSERNAAQRRYDLARVSAGLSYLDGRSGQHAARTAELVGYLLQAAEQK